jgi:hypothetical protein
MTIEIRPTNGGFQRSIRTTPFIVSFLKGLGPENSKKIDPDIGAPMADIHREYKLTLHRLHAQEMVDNEQEERIRRGKPAYAEAEYKERFQFFLDRIPYKLHKMRYSSFTRYFGHLIRLGWIEKSGKIEASAFQDDYPPAPSRVYYRLTKAGWKATEAQMADPLMTLYGYSRRKRSAKRNRYSK